MKKIVTTILITLTSSLILAQSINHTFKNLENEIQAAIKANEIPSLVFGIVQNGKIIYEASFGYADLENDVLATIDTPYQLASLTKPITATAIMRLHERGVIHIDHPITQYMPGLVLEKVDENFNTPTIRQVLNHTSGLGTYLDIAYSDEDIETDDFEDGWNRYGTLFHNPGEKSEYSNLGYGLLDYIIATNAGMSFSEFLSKEIFEPLMMKSSFLSDEKQANGFAAKKYTHDIKPLPLVDNNTPGAGNIYASVYDILQFGMFHLNNPTKNALLSKSTVIEMQNYKEPNALFHYYEDSYYGLGWYVRPNDNGKRIVWHEGGMIGASTMLKLFPEENIAIAVATNISNNALCRSIVNKISSHLLPGYKPSPINEIADYKNVAADTAMLGAWEGNISVEGENIPISMWIEENETTIQYLDKTLISYFTEYQPLPNKSSLLFSVINQHSFIGTGIGLLPASNLRKEYNHLLSIKLLRKEDVLTGTIMVLPTAEREYYVYPYHIVLKKQY